MKKVIKFLFILVLLPSLTFAQDATVVYFKHTLRWLDESKFPNYFLIQQERDSIYKNIREDLMLQFNVSDVIFPDKVDYRIITGFGKPKNELLVTNASSGYIVDIFSFITRATTGYGVF